MSKSTNITIVILTVFLVLMLGYEGYKYYGSIKDNEKNTLLQQGYGIGYSQAVAQLYQEAIKCQPVPVRIENQTISMIAIGCPGTEAIVQASQQAQ